MSERASEVELALLRADMDSMKEDMKGLREEIKTLVEAWKTANNVLVFIKWLAGLGTAVAAFWLLIKAKLGA